MALLPPLDFLGDRQTLLERGGIGLLGFGQKFLDFQIEFLELLLGVAVAHGGVLAGIGQNLGAIDGYGDLTDFEDSAAGGHFQNLREGPLEKRSVFSAKSAKRVVVGVGVGAEKSHGHIAVAGPLDLATGKLARAIGVDQKCQEHGRGILLVPGAAVVDLGARGVDRLDGVDDEMHEMVAGDPVAQVRWKEHGGVAVDVDESSHIKLRSRN